jgi:hypothetical protein
MEPAELVTSLLLVVVLLALAGYFGWRQLQALRGLRQQIDLPREERRFVRNQSRRRLVVSLLMVLLALMLVGNYFVDERLRQIIPPDKEAAAQREHTPEEEAFARLYAYYWVVFLLLILVILCLGVADLMAIQRFGMRQFRRLQIESRASLQEQAERLRSQRNGHS